MADRPAPGETRHPLPVRLLRYGRRELRPAATPVRRAVRSFRRRNRPVPAGHEARDLDRQWQWSACYAPLTSMYLDQFGQVRACCQNTDHPLGQIGDASLRQIWDGSATGTLRTALRGNDLSAGCEFCAWQVAEIDPHGWFLRLFDQHPAGWSSRPAWPKQLEFAVSNTCNLQCVMCNGDWSSSIRAQREHRPPLPSAYPETFYEELVDFIPHLREAKFTGGEPFLGSEPQRIMDLLVEHGDRDLVLNVVTNATILNDRVERTLHALRPWITVSLDGGTEEVYERVRVGASFPQVLANVDRFAEIAASRGMGVNLAHCLMVDNWETFPELLELAESRGLEVFVTTVRFPEHHSLHQLPPEQLREVVEALDRRTPWVEARISGARLAAWHDQLGFLRTRADATTWPAALGVPPDPAGPTAVPVQLTPRDARPARENR